MAGVRPQAAVPENHFGADPARWSRASCLRGEITQCSAPPAAPGMSLRCRARCEAQAADGRRPQAGSRKIARNEIIFLTCRQPPCYVAALPQQSSHHANSAPHRRPCLPAPPRGWCALRARAWRCGAHDRVRRHHPRRQPAASGRADTGPQPSGRPRPGSFRPTRGAAQPVRPVLRCSGPAVPGGRVHRALAPPPPASQVWAPGLHPPRQQTLHARGKSRPQPRSLRLLQHAVRGR